MPTMSNAIPKATRRMLAPRATSSRRLCRLSINASAPGPDAEDQYLLSHDDVTQQNRSVQGGDVTRLTVVRERHKPSVVLILPGRRFWAIDNSIRTPIR